MAKRYIFVLIFGILALAAALVLLVLGPPKLRRPSQVALADTTTIPVPTPGRKDSAEKNDNLEADTAPTEDEHRIPMENLLFLGDSMIANPETIRHIFSENGHQVLAGHGATIPQFFSATKSFVSVGAEGMGLMTGTIAGREFNAAVILLGANDISFLPAEQAMESYRQLLKELNAFTDAPVIVLKLFPAGESYGNYYGEPANVRNEHSGELNRLLKSYCDHTDGIYFADATGAFTDSDGYLLMDAGDGLHVSVEQYDLFYEEIIAALKRTNLFE